jgi:hypothetical protein
VNLFISPPFIGSIRGRKTMLQAERSQLQFLMRSVDFSIYLIAPASVLSSGWMSLHQKWVPSIFPLEVKCIAGMKASQPHHHLLVYCLDNMRTSTSHSPTDLHGQVQGHLYFFSADIKRHAPHLKLSLYFRKWYWHRTHFLFYNWDFLNFYIDGLTSITRCWVLHTIAIP